MAYSIAPNSATFLKYKDDLINLYKRARYNELICSRLMGRAVKVESWVRGSVLLLVAFSLLTCSTSYLNPPVLTPVWAAISGIATLLAVYSLIVASSAKQFLWFGLSTRFAVLADRAEFFGIYVRNGKVTEAEFLNERQYFASQIADLLQSGGI